jgi:hypothetical protein
MPYTGRSRRAPHEPRPARRVTGPLSRRDAHKILGATSASAPPRRASRWVRRRVRDGAGSSRSRRSTIACAPSDSTFSRAKPDIAWRPCTKQKAGSSRRTSRRRRNGLTQWDARPDVPTWLRRVARAHAARDALHGIRVQRFRADARDRAVDHGADRRRPRAGLSAFVGWAILVHESGFNHWDPRTLSLRGGQIPTLNVVDDTFRPIAPRWRRSSRRPRR